MAGTLAEIEYLRNNPNLKSANAKEYVDKDTFNWRILEMKKIANDIIYFARNYFYIISLDKGKCLILPYPKQEEIIRDMTKYKRLIILASRQTGKCVFLLTLIKVRNKKTGKILYISIGDFFNRIKSN